MKRTRVQRALRRMRRGGSLALVTSLERQLDEVLAACRLAHDVAAGTTDITAAREKMKRIEHKGDVQRAELVRGLAGVLVAPIDREDLFRLSRSIDDVLDNIHDFVRELDLYEMAATDVFSAPLEEAATAIDDLRAAVRTITRSPAETARRRSRPRSRPTRSGAATTRRWPCSSRDHCPWRCSNAASCCAASTSWDCA